MSLQYKIDKKILLEKSRTFNSVSISEGYYYYFCVELSLVDGNLTRPMNELNRMSVNRMNENVQRKAIKTNRVETTFLLLCSKIERARTKWWLMHYLHYNACGEFIEKGQLSVHVFAKLNLTCLLVICNVYVIDGFSHNVPLMLCSLKIGRQKIFSD